MKRAGSKGASMVEIVMAVAVIAIVTAGIISVYPLVFRLSMRTINDVQAGLLLEEGIEAVKTIRDKGWTTNIGTGLTASTTYQLVFATSTGWSASVVPAVIDDTYHRTFSVYYICRGATDDIVEMPPSTTAPTCSSPNKSDTNARQVKVSVAWKEGNATTSRSISTYITNIFND